MEELRFRQIHLDFHTSPYIPDVGDDFDAEEFAETLKNAHVNSINIFSKDCHGLCYYPTKIGKRHPSLKRDLLGEMITALHKRDIKCPVYFSIGWDEWNATHHQEWVQIDSTGRLVDRAPYDGNEWHWKYMCFNTSYMDQVNEQISEIMDLYDVDGFWFDILFYDHDGCSCSKCLNDMLEKGLDPSDIDVRRDFTIEVINRETAKITELVKSKNPNATIFFNGRQRLDSIYKRSPRRELKNATHIEIESLPSGFWGYNHFPMFVRYYRNLGQQIIGMNGKFHLEWGDFGGFKTRVGLEYECFRILASGGKISVGDQMHPRGKLDKVTYDLIGEVFKQVESKEEWCSNVSPVSDIALMLQNDDDSRYGKYCRPEIHILEAAMQMLLEDHRQFEIVDWESELSPYKLLILPDNVILDEAKERIISDYRNQGGKVLLTGLSGLNTEKTSFQCFDGLEDCGESEYKQSYLRIEPAVWNDIPKTDYVCYLPQRNVKATKGAEAFAKTINPYFNRDWKKFCSHMQTPPNIAESPEFDAIVKGEGFIYAAAPLFTLYKKYGNHIYKELISHCIDELIGTRMIDTNLPSTAELLLQLQAEKNRKVLHILHYPVQKRSKIEMIEDVLPLYDVEVSMESKIPETLYLAPQMKQIPFSFRDDRLEFSIPKVEGHQMVVIQY